MEEYFKFQAGWYKAIQGLPRVIQGEVLTAVIQYGLYGETTESLGKTSGAVFELVKMQMDRSKVRSSNGKKGGRRKINIEERKPKAKPVYKTLGGKARQTFEEHCKQVYGNDYYWSPKDAGAMKLLLQKLRNALEQKNMPTDDERVLSTLKMFLEAIKDDWVLTHFSVSVVNSHYNEIVNNIKSIKNENRSNWRSSKRDINGAVLQSLATDIAAHQQGMAHEGEKPW